MRFMHVKEKNCSMSRNWKNAAGTSVSHKQKIAWMYQYKQLDSVCEQGDSTNLHLFTARYHEALASELQSLMLDDPFVANPGNADSSASC